MIETYDLSTKEGTLAYIEGAVLIDIRKAFEMRGALAPFGVALVTQRNGTKLRLPQPLVVGTFGAPTRVIKRTLRKTAQNGAAVGAVFARLATFPVKGSTREAEAVVVQLEHEAYGDLAWMAPVVDGALQSFSAVEHLDATALDIKPTRFMPQRYMH